MLHSKPAQQPTTRIVASQKKCLCCNDIVCRNPNAIPKKDPNLTRQALVALQNNTPHYALKALNKKKELTKNEENERGKVMNLEYADRKKIRRLVDSLLEFYPMETMFRQEIEAEWIDGAQNIVEYCMSESAHVFLISDETKMRVLLCREEFEGMQKITDNLNFARSSETFIRDEERDRLVIENNADELMYSMYQSFSQSYLLLKTALGRLHDILSSETDVRKDFVLLETTTFAELLERQSQERESIEKMLATKCRQRERSEQEEHIQRESLYSQEASHWISIVENESENRLALEAWLSKRNDERSIVMSLYDESSSSLYAEEEECRNELFEKFITSKLNLEKYLANKEMYDTMKRAELEEESVSSRINVEEGFVLGLRALMVFNAQGHIVEDHRQRLHHEYVTVDWPACVIQCHYSSLESNFEKGLSYIRTEEKDERVAIEQRLSADAFARNNMEADESFHRGNVAEEGNVCWDILMSKFNAHHDRLTKVAAEIVAIQESEDTQRIQIQSDIWSSFEMVLSALNEEKEIDFNKRQQWKSFLIQCRIDLTSSLFEEHTTCGDEYLKKMEGLLQQQREAHAALVVDLHNRVFVQQRESFLTHVFYSSLPSLYSEETKAWNDIVSSHTKIYQDFLLTKKCCEEDQIDEFLLEEGRARHKIDRNDTADRTLLRQLEAQERADAEARAWQRHLKERALQMAEDARAIYDDTEEFILPEFTTYHETLALTFPRDMVAGLSEEVAMQLHLTLSKYRAEVKNATFDATTKQEEAESLKNKTAKIQKEIDAFIVNRSSAQERLSKMKDEWKLKLEKANLRKKGKERDILALQKQIADKKAEMESIEAQLHEARQKKHAAIMAKGAKKSK